RQVEHVSRLEDPGLVRLEIRQHANIQTGHELLLMDRLRRDAPLALSGRLQQEDVVVVDVRADVAAIRRIAHHHVVNAPARKEAEMLEQIGDVRHPLINLLYEERPMRLRQRGEVFFLERTVPQLPWLRTAALDDDPRFGLLLERQPGQVFGRNGRLEGRKGAAHEQRLLLPVLVKELLVREPAQQSLWTTPRHSILVIRSSSADCRHPILVVRSSTLDPGNSILVVRSWSFDPGPWVLVVRSWSSAPRHPRNPSMSLMSGHRRSSANTMAAILSEPFCRGRSYPQYGHSSAAESIGSAQEGHSRWFSAIPISPRAARPAHPEAAAAPHR